MTESTKKSADNLRNRLIFGFSGFFLLMGGMLYNAWTYGFVFLVVCVMCLWEFYDLLLQSGKRPLKYYGMAMGVALYCLTFLVEVGAISPLFFFGLYPAFAGTFILKLYDKNENLPFENIALTLLGVVYVAMPFAAMHIAVFSQGAYSYQVIMGMFFLIWINDITAYFVGQKYGKHKLFERISPKKSWEGTAAGLANSILMVGLLSVYLPDLLWWQWAVVGLLVVVVGTQGDLIESMLKRSLQVKDSAQNLPGHGGFLDRFDNLLLIAPFAGIFLYVFS
jgi:phosphatidate cytidylyltransferase